MTGQRAMLDCPNSRTACAAYVMVEGATKGMTEYREEAVLPLQTFAASGAMARGDIIRMTGLRERTGRKVVSRFLSEGLLKSEGHRGELGIASPMSALNILLPNLYPEASSIALD